MHDPREQHFTALKYIKGSIYLGLRISRTSTTNLSAYTDADWAGCRNSQKSTSGYCVFLDAILLAGRQKDKIRFYV